jgi:peptide/nickel transport system substrate-binding protein
MAALAAALLSLSAAAASRSSSQATIPLLRVGLAESDSTLDQTKDDGAVHVTSAALETLQIIDHNGQLRPWLATSVTQPGPAVYVYHLRHGVKFWDGTGLTADDVANSLNYYRAPGSQAAYLYTSVKSITAKDKYTVVVTLKHVDASWKYAVAQYPSEIFEKAFQQAHKADYGKPGTLTMGTGPWIVKSLDPTSGAELDANPHYWGGKPSIQHISIKFFADETSMALAMRAGAIDIAPQVQSAQSFASSSNTKLQSSPSCQAALLGLNVNVAPWNDVHVRRAVAYALDRNGILKVYGAPAQANSTLIPPQMLKPIASQAQIDKLLKSINLYPHSIAKAKAELAQSKYPNGFTGSLEESQFGSVIQVSQAIAGQLAPIGIKLSVQTVSSGKWLADITTPPRDKYGAVFTPSGCNSPDPSFYAFLLGKKNLAAGGFNIANYDPPGLDAQITAGTATTSNAKRFAIYSALLKRLSNDVPYVPLLVQDGNLGTNGKVKWPTFDANWYNRVWALEIKP